MEGWKNGRTEGWKYQPRWNGPSRLPYILDLVRASIENLPLHRSIAESPNGSSNRWPFSVTVRLSLTVGYHIIAVEFETGQEAVRNLVTLAQVYTCFV